LNGAKEKTAEEYINHKQIIGDTVQKIRNEIAQNPVQETGTRVSQREESDEVAPERDVQAQDLTSPEESIGTGLTIAGGINTAASKVNGALSSIKGISVGTSSIGGVISGISSLLEAYSAYKEMVSSNNSTGTKIEKGLEGTEKMTNVVLSTTSAVYQIQFAKLAAKMTEKEATAALNGSAAQIVAGGAAVVMGAIEMIRGGYEGWNAKKRSNLLNELQETLLKNPEKNKKMLEAVDQASHVQGIKLIGGIAQMAKGAAMIVGGSLLLASNPVGWMVLGGAAAISLIYAGYKWYKEKKRKTAVVEQQLDIVEERKAWEARKEIRGTDDKSDPDPMGRELKKSGYHNDAKIKWYQFWKEDDITAFYNKYIEDTAKYLIGSVTNAETEDAKMEATKTLKAMGFDPNGKTPLKWEKVAKAFK